MLRGCGWSQRRIARELGINRETVAKYRWEAFGDAPSYPSILLIDSLNRPPQNQPGCLPGRRAHGTLRRTTGETTVRNVFGVTENQHMLML